MQVRINDLSKVYCTSDWSWDTGYKKTGDFDLWTIVGGKGTLKCASGETYDISRGDCFLLRYYERYIGSHDPENPLEVIYVHFDYVDSKGSIIIPKESELPALHRRIKDISFIEELLNRTNSYYKSPSKETWRANHWLQSILMKIAANDERGYFTEVDRVQLDMIEKVCETILRFPTNEYKIADFASSLHYSPDHFCRVFKKVKKVTPQEFIIRTKIDYAKILLCNSSHSITRIAELTGYKDIYHFSKQFTERIGISPSKYRKL